MAGPPRVRSEPENRPVLVPAGNKARPAAGKPLKKAEKQPPELEKKVVPAEPVVRSPKLGAVGTGRRKAVLLRSNFSMNGSCSSDASSSDSSQSRGSSGGRVVRGGVIGKKKQCVEKLGDLESEKVEKSGEEFNLLGSDRKKRCAWITSSSEQCYVVFHDEEWGVPVHDDKKLFELLSLSGALAELTWPAILSRRHIFREVFLNFDPFAVAKLNEKKFVAPGMPANSLLSESKLRGIIENAHQICKVIIEFGSFDKFIWSFVNHKPIVSQFRYPRQVPAKTSKADVISKELVKRGFRSVGPTVIYTFMQAAGFTNDHLISCFRFQECIAGPTKDKDGNVETKGEAKALNDTAEMVLAKSIDGLSIS